MRFHILQFIEWHFDKFAKVEAENITRRLRRRGMKLIENWVGCSANYALVKLLAIWIYNVMLKLLSCKPWGT